MRTSTILGAGLIASVVMAMFQMVGEAVLPGGTGFFGPPIAIGATVVRSLQGSEIPLPFDLLALVAGLMGHMMNSVILTAVFAALASRALGSAGTIGLAIAGMAWGVAVFAVMWAVVVPAIDPLVGTFNAAWFAAAHLMWGAAVGVGLARLGTPERATAPAFAR